MTRVELTEATAPLADYARQARRGPVVLTRRGRPVAMLRPPGSGIRLDEVVRELRPAAVRRSRRSAAPFALTAPQPPRDSLDSAGVDGP